MSQTNSPNHSANLDQEPLPRLLQLGEEVLAFEGLTEALEGGGNVNGLHSRADCLILPQLAGMVINVTWRNFNNAVVTGEQIANPFDPVNIVAPTWATTKVFTAALEVAPQVLDAAWQEQEDRFDLSYKAAANGDAPKKEFTDLLISGLAMGIKLELTTPVASYVGRAASLQNNPIVFSQFRPYGWELFSDDTPQPKHLHIPDIADLETLRARFTANDPNFGGIGQSPLVGGRRA